MYPPGFLLQGARAYERELEQKAARARLLREVEARTAPHINPLRTALLHLGRLLEYSGTRLQQAASYPGRSSSQV